MKNCIFILLFIIPITLFAQDSDSLKIAQEIDSLIQFSQSLLKKEKWDSAFQLIYQSKQIVLDNFGELHFLYGKVVFNEARIYNKMKNYKEAEENFLKALTIMENVLGNENLVYTKIIGGIAGFYEDWGKFKKAEALYLKSKNIRKKILGTKHPLYASSLNYLAALYYAFGYYEKAENYYLEAITIYKRILPKNLSHYANVLNNLAILYTKMGKYEKAETLYIESKNIREDLTGKKHPDYANSLGNLGGLYFKLRLYDKAESMFLESKAIREEVLGKEHPEYLAVAMNLAVVYKIKEQYQKAKLLYNENMPVLEKVYSKEHPKYALHLIGLGNVYNEVGDYELADSLYQESKDIQERVLGKEHPDYTQSLNNLAILYYEMRKYDMADSMFLECKIIRERVLGKGHPDYLSSVKNFPSLNETLEHYEATEANFTEIVNLQQAQLSKAANFLSENELVDYIQSFIENGEKMLSFILERKAKKIPLGRFPNLCYDNSLFHKGFLLNSSLKAKQLISKSPDAVALNNELKSYRRRLAQQYSKTIQERDSLLVAELEEKANAAEKKLAREVAGYEDAFQKVEWKDVQNSLKKGEAAIEFVHFKVDFPEETDSIMYAALLLLPDSQQPQFIPLFEEKEIRKFFQIKENKGDAYAENINTIYDLDWGNFKNIYELIWQPLDSFLTNIDRVIYSPSGLLHKVSFAALPVSKDARLMDKYNLQLVTSTREIVTKDESENSLIASVALFGDIDYKNKNNNENTSTVADISTNRSVLKCELLRTGGTIDSLPGSTKEIQFLQNLFTENGINSVNIKKRKAAGETAFKMLGVGKPSPSILHISTHGFFFELSDVDSLNCGDSVNTNWEAIITSQNPLLRSGLLMSGAEETVQSNENSNTNDDGILTSLEIANVDLSNTQLAVLSACETGLGDIADMEGVYGLQRAFKVAGVDKILMTLWKVDDEITNLFMQIFYTHLLNGTTPEKALQLAQNEIREENPRPFYWAGFILL